MRFIAIATNIMTKGEQLLGITLEKGNNDREQNDMEATAHMINRAEKARHLGPNFKGSQANLDWAVDQAQTHFRKAAIFLKEALEMNR